MNARERARRIERLMQGEADIERARQRIARESAGDVDSDRERTDKTVAARTRAAARNGITNQEGRRVVERVLREAPPYTCTPIARQKPIEFTINVPEFLKPNPEDVARAMCRALHAEPIPLPEPPSVLDAFEYRVEPAPKFKVGDRVTLRGYRGAGRVVEATTIQARVFWPWEFDPSESLWVDARFLVHDEPDPLDTFAADHGLVAEPQPAKPARPLAVGDRVRSTQNRAVRGTIVADYDSVRRWAVRWDGHGICRHKPDDIERIEGGE